MNIEVLEQAAGEAAQNLFRMKYPEGQIPSKEFSEILADTVFVINNFMRISANLAEQENGDSNS